MSRSVVLRWRSFAGCLGFIQCGAGLNLAVAGEATLSAPPPELRPAANLVVPPKPGTTLNVGSRKALITRVDALPYFESEYAKRFRLDTFTNPKLRQLRERYQLEEVVASGKTEFEKQVLLLDWVHHQFKKFGPGQSPTADTPQRDG